MLVSYGFVGHTIYSCQLNKVFCVRCEPFLRPGNVDVYPAEDVAPYCDKSSDSRCYCNEYPVIPMQRLQVKKIMEERCLDNGHSRHHRSRHDHPRHWRA